MIHRSDPQKFFATKNENFFRRHPQKNLFDMLTDAYGNDDFGFFANALNEARGSLNKRAKLTGHATGTVTNGTIKDKTLADLIRDQQARHSSVGTHTVTAIHGVPTSVMGGKMPARFDPDNPLAHLGNITQLTQPYYSIDPASISTSNGTRQVGGTHYAKLTITPFDYALENKLDPLQFSVVKYVTRFREKGGIEDLNKAVDCLQRLIKFEHSKGRK